MSFKKGDGNSASVATAVVPYQIPKDIRSEGSLFTGCSTEVDVTTLTGDQTLTLKVSARGDSYFAFDYLTGNS